MSLQVVIFINQLVTCRFWQSFWLTIFIRSDLYNNLVCILRCISFFHQCCQVVWTIHGSLLSKYSTHSSILRSFRLRTGQCRPRVLRLVLTVLLRRHSMNNGRLQRMSSSTDPVAERCSIFYHSSGTAWCWGSCVTNLITCLLQCYAVQELQIALDATHRLCSTYLQELSSGDFSSCLRTVCLIINCFVLNYFSIII